MAGWISSKLKAAETLLHQIDQQAAESLGKSPSASDLATLQPPTDPILDVPPRRPLPAGPPPSLGLRVAAKHPSPSQPPPSPGPRRSASAAAVLALQDQAGGVPVGAVAEARAKVEGNREDRDVGKDGPSESDSGSDDDSDRSGSDSEDSEEERRREEKRRQRRAERLAAMAARAIAEREEAVARLEGEKAGLEKLLTEREKEQAQEGEVLGS